MPFSVFALIVTASWTLSLYPSLPICPASAELQELILRAISPGAIAAPFATEGKIPVTTFSWPANLSAISANFTEALASMTILLLLIEKVPLPPLQLCKDGMVCGAAFLPAALVPDSPETQVS